MKIKIQDVLFPLPSSPCPKIELVTFIVFNKLIVSSHHAFYLFANKMKCSRTTIGDALTTASRDEYEQGKGKNQRQNQIDISRFNSLKRERQFVENSETMEYYHL